jgi:putative ABC transport system permease protein
MTFARLVRAFVLRQPGTWCLHVLTLALGAMVVTSLLLIDRAVEQRFERDLAGVDLVVGAKGSALQIVLSALLQLDAPTGNIALSEAQRFSQHPLVRTAVPIAMGDSVQGVRIVGTTPQYGDLYGASMREGVWWSGQLQAVLGAQAARRLRLDVGSKFAGQHGLSGGEAHAAHEFVVTGILQPTGSTIDRLVLTDLASVWRVHAHDEDAAEAEDLEVTALLVRYRSAMGAITLPMLVSRTADLQPAVPAIEVARLVNLLGMGADVLRWIGLALLALAAGGFVAALLSAVSLRRKELALLRALGSSRRLLWGLMAAESVLLGLCGGALGVLASRGLMLLVANFSGAAGMTALQPPAFGTIEIGSVAGAVLLALLAALPALSSAARIDPVRELARR